MPPDSTTPTGDVEGYRTSVNNLHSADVYVTGDGLVFLTDMSGAGLYILEYTGASR
jgi:hypothetical protein